MVIKNRLEPLVEPHFHDDSYGYRPGKSALDAIAQARQRCWRDDWVLDMDIKGVFDALDHGLVMKAVAKYTNCQWTLLYIERWLKADVILPNGERIGCERGTPQGGVISPLLANIFLHLVFDQWMQKHFQCIHFERYADDIVVHCRSETQLKMVEHQIRRRFTQCGLKSVRRKPRLCTAKTQIEADTIRIRALIFWDIPSDREACGIETASSLSASHRQSAAKR
jgi:RNA-directed DNA polymerase